MRSIDPVEVDPSGSDRTAKARIRDAAITSFANAGFSATSVRTIASAAGVSPALVIHHFGSKQSLRQACDQHVAALVDATKRAAITSAHTLDPLADLRSYTTSPPVLRYLARTLSDASPEVATLIDRLVADAELRLEEAERLGVTPAIADRHGTAVIATTSALGLLVLHEQLRRLLGVDLTGEMDEGAERFMASALDVFGRGLLTDEVYREMRRRVAQRAAEESGR